MACPTIMYVLLSCHDWVWNEKKLIKTQVYHYNE